MPKGYFFGEFEITDPAAYEVYRMTVPNIISAHEGRILVRGGDPQPLDGTVPQRRFVIVEFDSPEAARIFYHSDAYQSVRPSRLNASTDNGFVLAERSGVGDPAPEPMDYLSKENAMFRTIRFAKAGGPEVLEFVNKEVAAPGPAEVRIKVKAIGLNRAESMWRNDKYVAPVRYPAGLGYEAAGIVDAVGKDVTGIAAGDAVSTIPAFSFNQYGTYGEVILMPAHVVVKHPKSLSFTEAAAVWMMFITAYGALIVDARIGNGDFVIIPAASSSVGLAAIQIANYAGATPIALTRTSEKKKRLLKAGAVHVIATQEQDMVAEVLRVTNGKGARIAFDPVGGPNFPKLIAALADRGIVYIYGALSKGDTQIPVLDMIAKMPAVKGYSVRQIMGDDASRRDTVEYIVKGLASGAFKPVIDRTFKFDDMVEAHRYLESSGQFGKIVVTV